MLRLLKSMDTCHVVFEKNRGTLNEKTSYMYTYIHDSLLVYVYIYTSVLLCISMHRESGYDSEVDPIVKYIKSIRWTQFGKV